VDKLVKSLDDVTKRLAAVEKKPATTKKSLPGDEPVEKQEVQKDAEGRVIAQWPSLTGVEEDD